MEQALFSAEGLSCRRGGRRIFEGIGFELKAGEVLLLTGANGSGKSSLLRLMAGLLRPDAGVLSWGGRDVQDDCAAHAARLCLVTQDDPVKPVWTVAEHLAFWAGLSGLDAGASASVLAGVLDEMGLAAKKDVAARFLSAGQKRRLNLCRLFLKPCSLWLLDEPLTALDASSAALLRAALDAHLRRGGRAAITTHEAGHFPSAHRELKLGKGSF